MKVLSISSPWAEFILSGLKSIYTHYTNGIEISAGDEILIHVRRLNQFIDARLSLQNSWTDAYDAVLRSIAAPAMHVVGSVMVKETRRVTEADSKAAMTYCGNPLLRCMVFHKQKIFKEPVYKLILPGWSELRDRDWPGATVRE